MSWTMWIAVIIAMVWLCKTIWILLVMLDKATEVKMLKDRLFKGYIRKNKV